MKKITFSADEHFIEAARERARAERSTLNEQFRRWLTHYARHEGTVQRCEQVIRELQQKLRTGGRGFTRDEMNER